MLNFIENIIKEKRKQYSGVLGNSHKEMVDEIYSLGLPEDKTKQVLEIVEKYIK